MKNVSWFLKASAVGTLAALIALGSVAGGVTSTAAQTAAATTAATAAATKAATKAATPVPLDTICKADPTKTPVPTTPAATTAATKAATAAATTAATKAATAAATKVVTAVATKPPATNVPPTATPIPKGKVPAWAGVTVNRSATLKRAGKGCINVLSVNAGGPAAVAGLKAGDLLLGVDKTTIIELPDLFSVIAEKKSGDVIEVTYQRDGKAVKAKLTLGANPTVIELTPAK